MKKQFNPTVFIGMPVFNSETTIRKTLESIVSQDYNEWKLFISDNSSSDMTRKICEEFASNDARITFYQQPKNIGGWNNFLFVFGKSTGTYFKFQAGDDVLSENYLSSNVSELEANNVILGSTSPDCFDWEYDQKVMYIDFELMGPQNSRLRSLKKNCQRSNGLFYAVFRKTELTKVITADIFESPIQIKDWLILSKLAVLGNIKRCSSGLMVLGSNGASNSKNLTWFTQLKGIRAKIFPYFRFYSLVKKAPGKISFRGIFELLTWLGLLQLKHFKGLMWLWVNRYGVRKLGGEPRNGH